jgi:serralysin
MCTICAQLHPVQPDCALDVSLATVVEGADAAGSTATGYSMSVGDGFSGTLSTEADRDWVAVTLTAGSVYEISLIGGTLVDPYLRVYDSSGNLVDFNDDNSGLDSGLTLTAGYTGTFYLSAGAFPDITYDNTGTYVMSINEAPVETTDAPADMSTPYTLNPGATFYGTLSSNGDRDWVAVNVVAGESYRVDLVGDSLNDPYLRVYDASGNLVDVNDDIASNNRDSALRFTATVTGTYYVSAGAYNDSGTGTYEVSVASVTTPTTGSLDTLADFLTDGYWQSNGGAGRAFDTSSSNVITVNLTGLTAEGQQLARWALEAWEMVANVQFSEVTTGGMITFDDNNSGAYSTSNVTNGVITSSHVNVSTAWISTYGTTLDSYSFQTYIHEVGHALGLGHQGAYNGAATYGLDETYANDSWQLSIMSYFSQNDNTTTSASYAALLTTMMADVIAIQNLYGAPAASSATSGNTVWGANSTLGNYLGQGFNDALNGSSSSTYGGNPVALTIYDRDGTDTLNLTPSVTDDRISLWHSTFSDVGGLTGNVGIARGTVIENALAGSGNDTIIGNWVGNFIAGNDGNDTVWANNGNDTVFGGNGNDLIGGGSENDQLWGGAGMDTIYGDAGNDQIGGAAGSDALWGASGNDSLYGDSGNDTLGGGGNDDEIWAGSDDDLLFGDGGNDTLGGGIGNDTAWGGEGNDVFYGFDGNDQLSGDAGNDTLWGGNGMDTLLGGADTDLLYGSVGNDSLNGQWGNDTLSGGSGADVFVYGLFYDNDEISDFSVGEGDRLQLDDALWGGGLTAAQVVSTYGTVHSWGTVFNFGGSYLTVLGANDAGTLAGQIDIF